MQNIIQYVTVLMLGIVLAGLYFGGLWWTVRRLPLVQRPWPLYFGSLLIRTVVVLGGFYVVLTQGGLPQLAACLIGFVAARYALIHRLAPRTLSMPSADKVAR